ncbi:MAG: hypothetical protein A2747_00385 [Candidatus Yonathbacteria bacterium RIFCSPHIGHO2_01_FULL_44_41]|uniref:2'-5' RNA ligase n=1 Tax=Candidatus Yonathbacteria bacterium RIFCSPHIGHO2_02_FULL_44_14 TaxID=1802724 RepID=A0A1G2SA79_9BACT|nr:MAG: hypothetical protein A2747_00385 [Candidatus Yonathbacteria bacterium RIFCSPHIGHO2_01_FULL_44_41]OHA81440.1 MAG: hypothetical protein A3B06_03185 [Candidatus Yonathbacteria bacterium RIFCSPLOWO2_01_FULL_43_20]OHA81960.1 MAG: hypothetical protein A3D51_03735 [Candidatus Yonathbacteria bacterium RIFCSPHIGHO2_02_FULL_44_14]
MRYFIAHLVKNPAAEYHRALVQYIAKRFDLKISAGYFPTHITLKAPFETQDITEAKDVLEKFTATHHALPFAVRGFGHFQNNVIFLDVELPQETSRAVKELQWALNSVPEIQWGEHEPLENLHITVAKKDIIKKFDNIWGYIEEKDIPQFDLLFDNIALLRFEDDVWIVDSVYALSS